jgi:hypothetical protein
MALCCWSFLTNSSTSSGEYIESDSDWTKLNVL